MRAHQSPVGRLKLFCLLLALLSPGLLQGPAMAEPAPVIDMHFHAWPYGESGPPDSPENIAAMNRLLDSLRQNNVVLATTSGPEAFLSYWHAAEPERLMLGPVLPCEGGQIPNSLRYQCYEDGGDWPDLEHLRAQYESGTYQVMGEIYTQYAGLQYDDPRMFPYYELAQELGIPVAFHTHSAPPLTASQCCPNFRLSFGDPLQLEEVLIRFPKLKVQIMHANPIVYPMVIDLMAQYPKVYVELSPFQRIMSREKFHRMLYLFKEANMLSRVMFGTDGDNHGAAIEAYSSADFLTERELEGILCNNAERFLGRREVCEYD